MTAAFICRVGQTECEGKDFFLQNIVSYLVLWPRIRSAMPLQRQLSASWHLNGFGISMFLLGSYRSHKTGPRSSFTPKTSLATQNAIRIGNKWLGNDNSRALLSFGDLPDFHQSLTMIFLQRQQCMDLFHEMFPQRRAKIIDDTFQLIAAEILRRCTRSVILEHPREKCLSF